MAKIEKCEYATEIENYNFTGLCMSKYCGRKYTHAATMRFGSQEILIPLCEEHAELFDREIKNER